MSNPWEAWINSLDVSGSPYHKATQQWQQSVSEFWSMPASYWQTVSSIYDNRARMMRNVADELPDTVKSLAQSGSAPEFVAGMQKAYGSWMSAAMDHAATAQTHRMHLWEEWRQNVENILPPAMRYASTTALTGHWLKAIQEFQSNNPLNPLVMGLKVMKAWQTNPFVQQALKSANNADAMPAPMANTLVAFRNWASMLQSATEAARAVTPATPSAPVAAAAPKAVAPQVAPVPQVAPAPKAPVAAVAPNYAPAPVRASALVAPKVEPRVAPVPASKPVEALKPETPKAVAPVKETLPQVEAPKAPVVASSPKVETPKAAPTAMGSAMQAALKAEAPKVSAPVVASPKAESKPAEQASPKASSPSLPESSKQLALLTPPSPQSSVSGLEGAPHHSSTASNGVVRSSGALVGSAAAAAARRSVVARRANRSRPRIVRPVR